VVLRELLVAFAVMVAFLFAGAQLLRLLAVTEPALTIAGGVVLFLIALRMVCPSPDRSMHEKIEGEPRSSCRWRSRTSPGRPLWRRKCC
jgi:small neutral amino acid transporter SnatA (MarC family)